MIPEIKELGEIIQIEDVSLREEAFLEWVSNNVQAATTSYYIGPEVLERAKDVLETKKFYVDMAMLKLLTALVKCVDWKEQVTPMGGIDGRGYIWFFKRKSK